LLELAKEIAISHHERWDGDGYPLGLKRSDIPISGRIVAIADVFDAITSKRVYKEPWPIERALAYLMDMRGRQFDPDIVDAFFAIENEMVTVRQSKNDEPESKPMILQIIDGDISFEQLIEQWR